MGKDGHGGDCFLRNSGHGTSLTLMTFQVRGHFQTTFADLNVIMTLGGGGGGGVWGCDVITDHKG